MDDYFMKLMAESVSMDMDDLDSRQKKAQSEADFLAEMLKMRKKLGDRTSEQLRRKARREEVSSEKTNASKQRTAVDGKGSVNNVKPVSAKPQVSTASNEQPTIAELFGNGSNSRSE